MRWTILLGAAALAPATFTAAQEANEPIATLELNKLEARSGACSAFLVAKNAISEKISSLNLDLVVFDQDGVIARRLAVDMGPLRSHKTVVKAFTIDGLACAQIDRLLLNDVISCQGESGTIDDCVDRVDTSSRHPTPFIK